MELEDITIFNLEMCADRGPCKATFSMMMLEGFLVIHDIAYIEKGRHRFIGLPRRKVHDGSNQIRVPVVEIPDMESFRRFERMVIQALDALAAPAREDATAVLAAGQDEVPSVR